MKMRLKQILLIYMFLKLMVSCCWSISSSSSSSSSTMTTMTTNLPPELIENVKSALLPIFGVNFRPPTIPKQQQSIIIPEALKQLYQLQEKFHLDTTSIPLRNTENANTVRSFLHVESTIDDRFKSPHEKFRLKFDLSSIPKNERLTAAHIKLISIGDNNTNDKECYQRILVKDIVRPGIKGIDGPITRIIDSKLINPRKNSTITLDVYPAVIRWLNNPKNNYGLLITTLVTNQKKNNNNKTTTMKKKKKKMVVLKNLQLRRQIATDANQPILLTFTDDGRNQPRKGYDLMKIQRKKRAISSSSSHHNRRNGGGNGGHHRKNERDPCRRRQMYVNFRDVGWSDWIVAPLGYDAYYCDGECDYPMPEHMNTTNHAIVQSLMNSVRPTDVPKPCCVPTQLSSMSMLYVDGQNKVILKNYKEMVVIGCGCR